MLVRLQQQYPQIWTHLCTEQGMIRQQVKIFVNNQLIEGSDSLKTSLKPGQEVIRPHGGLRYLKDIVFTVSNI